MGCYLKPIEDNSGSNDKFGQALAGSHQEADRTMSLRDTSSDCPLNQGSAMAQVLDKLKQSTWSPNGKKPVLIDAKRQDVAHQLCRHSYAARQRLVGFSKE